MCDHCVYIGVFIYILTILAPSQIREQIAEHGKELGEEVFRNTEVSMKSIHDLSKQADRQRRLGESELSAVREGQQVLEIEQAVRVDDKSLIFFFVLLQIFVCVCYVLFSA